MLIKNNNEDQTYVWSLSTRLFHTSLVLFIIIAWLSADDDFLQIHSAFGYAIGALILFRFIWGIIGPKYSHFRDFNFSIKKAIEFSKNILTHNNKKYLGHNPAASLTLFFMLILIGLIVFSGTLALGEQEAKGIFSGLNNTFFKKLEFFESLHEVLANTLLLFIFIHLSGVLVDTLLHKKDQTLKSIITGYKHIRGENIKTNLFQNTIALLFFIITVVLIYYTFSNGTILY